MKKIVIAAAVLATAFALAVPATANALPPYDGTVVSNSSGVAGIVTYASGDTGVAAGTEGSASLTCNNTLVGTKNVVVAADHSLGFTFTLPTSAAAGSTCSLAVVAGAFTDSEVITVVGAVSDAGVSDAGVNNGGLAFTGLDATPYIWFGGGLLVLGASFLTMVSITRRSRKASVNS